MKIGINSPIRTSALALSLLSFNACGFHIDKDPVQPNYASIRSHILETKCNSCHYPGAKKVHSIDLTTYNGVLGKGLVHPLIRPGNPEQSDLYQSLKLGKMPKNRPRLSQQELDAVAEWIRRGAPEHDGGPAAPEPSHVPEPPDEP